MSTVLITGASRGIGRATAKAFADSGWDLLLLARSEDDLEKLVEEIDNKKVKVFYKSIDLSNSKNISKGIVELMNNGLIPSVHQVLKPIIRINASARHFSKYLQPEAGPNYFPQMALSRPRQQFLTS